nr:sensor domain-containing diguanylate cyclase [Klebsiella michiganensis]
MYLPDSYRLRRAAPAYYVRAQQQRNADPEGFSVPWNDSLCKRALDDRCIFSNDVAERWRSCLAAQDLGIATFFSIPVRLTDGSLFGTLCATSRARQPYNIEGEQVMNLFANLISHYVEKETLVQQLRAANVALEMHSYTDELTGLPNRRSLFKHLAAQFSQAREQQRSVLLIFIDLDDFKAINDRFGHPCGDSFLIQIGERLAARVRSSDIVGRLGGDEFLIVGPGPDSADQQEYIAALRQALAGIYFLGEHRINYPGASFGVIEADPWQIDVELALRAADEAMYQDKQSRRQGRFFHID